MAAGGQLTLALHRTADAAGELHLVGRPDERLPQIADRFPTSSLGVEIA